MCASVDLHFGVAGVENCQTAQLESDDRSKIGGSHTVKILVSQLLTTQLWVSTGYLPGRSLPGRSVRRPGSSLHPFPASASNTLYSGWGDSLEAASRTTHRTLGGFNRKLLSLGPGGWKPEIQVWRALVAPGASLLGGETATSSLCLPALVPVCVSVLFSSYKDQS